MNNEQATRRALNLVNRWITSCSISLCDPGKSLLSIHILVDAISLEIENVYQSSYNEGYQQRCIDEDTYSKMNTS